MHKKKAIIIINHNNCNIYADINKHDFSNSEKKTIIKLIILEFVYV